MKKKKDPAFDDLKAKVIKPLKDVVNLIKDHFAQTSTIWQERSQTDFVTLDESITSDPKVLSYLKDKRVTQINKERKATCDRLRDTSDKIAKKYGTLAGNLRGFNI